MKLLTKTLTIVVAVFTISGLVACEQKQHTMQGYIEGRYTYIASAVAGTLQELAVKRGDSVKAGQKLFELERDPEAANLAGAKQKLAQSEQVLADLEKGQRDTVLAAIQAQKDQAAANLNLSGKTFLRYQKLFKQGVLARQDLDQALAQYKSDRERFKQMEANLNEAKLGARENTIKAQEALVKAAQAEIDQASWAYDQKTKYAPLDAIVFDNLYGAGEFVPANQTVLALIALEDIKLIFYVPENKLSTIHLKQKVRFRCDGCSKEYFAVINFISPQAEYTPPVIFSQDSRGKLVFKIEAALDAVDAAQLHPGQPVDVMLY